MIFVLCFVNIHQTRLQYSVKQLIRETCAWKKTNIRSKSRSRNVVDVSSIISQNLPYCINGDFDLLSLGQQVRNECVKEQGQKYVEDAFKLGYSAHLLARINLFLNNSTVKSALALIRIHPKVYNGYN